MEIGERSVSFVLDNLSEAELDEATLSLQKAIEDIQSFKITGT